MRAGPSDNLVTSCEHLTASTPLDASVPQMTGMLSSAQFIARKHISDVAGKLYCRSWRYWRAPGVCRADVPLQGAEPPNLCTARYRYPAAQQPPGKYRTSYMLGDPQEKRDPGCYLLSCCKRRMLRPLDCCKTAISGENGAVGKDTLMNVCYVHVY